MELRIRFLYFIAYLVNTKYLVNGSFMSLKGEMHCRSPNDTVTSRLFVYSGQ